MTTFKQELKPMLTLALPVILSQMGQMMMPMVDAIMVGKLGPQYIGAVGMGNAFYYIAFVLGFGVLLGLDFLSSHAFGRKDYKECHYWLIQAIFLAVMVAIPLSIALYFSTFLFEKFGMAPEIASLARPYLQTLCPVLFPVYLFFSFRQYLQSMSIVKPTMVILFLANGVNLFFNWLFVFGNWGMPQLGIKGSALSTVLSASFMFIAIVSYTLIRDRRGNWGLLLTPRRFDKMGIKRLLDLGIPSSLHLLFEVGVFSITSVFAGLFGPLALASHHIVLNIASFTFMVPLGLSAAAAVRVGQALGRNSKDDAQGAGWTAIKLAAVFMTVSALILFIFRETIVGLFTTDTETVARASKLLLLAVVFQIADGLQVATTGVLRGMSNTRTPMIANLFGHWVVGLPVGLLLGFQFAYNVEGLWTGLTVGLFVVAVLLLIKVKRSFLAL